MGEGLIYSTMRQFGVRVSPLRWSLRVVRLGGRFENCNALRALKPHYHKDLTQWLNKS
jgi:hypothetical protein